MRRTIGENVKKWRLKRGFSQEQLAFESGLHRTYVSAVERGLRNPTVEIVGKLALALSVRPMMLLDDYDEKTDLPLIGEG